MTGCPRRPAHRPDTDTDKLAVPYAAAESKIDAAAKKKKASKQDLTLLAKFAGKFPPTLARVMAGR